MGLELYTWLAVAGLAFCSARILLWRTRRSLSRAGQVSLVKEIQLVPVSEPLVIALPEAARPSLAS